MPLTATIRVEVNTIDCSCRASESPAAVRSAPVPKETSCDFCGGAAGEGAVIAWTESVYGDQSYPQRVCAECSHGRGDS